MENMVFVSITPVTNSVNIVLVVEVIGGNVNYKFMRQNGLWDDEIQTMDYRVFKLIYFPAHH